MQRLAWATFSGGLQGLTTVLVLALWAAPAPAASAQDDEGWAFRFAPYIWGIAMCGDARVGGTTTEIDTSAADCDPSESPHLRDHGWYRFANHPPYG